MLRRLQELKKRNEGFTIVEVMIVLAIAGLILLIVFIAVPALQRNSRNTQIRSDVAQVLGMISEYGSNNNGSLPTAICTPGTDGVVRAVSSGTCGAGSAQIGTVRAGTTVASGTTMPTATNTITVYLNRKCASATAFATAATNRAIAAGFLVETAANGTQAQCRDS